LAHGPYIDQYRKAAVQTASPLQLIVMLYDGAVRFMNQAVEAMGNRDLPNQNLYLQKTQAILSELMSSLDLERGGEIATNLFSLYSFCYDELVIANLKDSPQHVQNAIKVIADLRESWAELERNQRTAPTEHGVQIAS